MRNLLKTTTFTLLIISCSLIRMDDSIDLGNKYRYIQDAPQVIIYHTSYKYKGVGNTIIPPIVKSYAFNDRYIIAKSQEVDEITGNSKGKLIQYWIIDKINKGDSVIPMDSLTFYNKLEEMNIDLSFKN